MTQCHIVDFKTPQGYLLRGLWFGPKKPKSVVVWVHGLGGSVFSMHNVIQRVAQSQTAVLTFNNRGHDLVSQISKKTRGKKKRILAGAAHEVFTDCVDDIQGAVNFARKQGVKNMYLAGHSTGCQKSIYWGSKTGCRGVKGIILLAPVSDHAAALAADRNGKLARLIKVARGLVKAGKKHTPMPASILNDGSQCDAQRFLSLNTPDSVETIFPYEQKSKHPRALQAVKNPILVLWAGDDEYADRPAKDIAAWFEMHTPQLQKIVIMPRAKHSFKGAEGKVVKEIREFIS